MFKTYTIRWKTFKFKKVYFISRFKEQDKNESAQSFIGIDHLLHISK